MAFYTSTFSSYLSLEGPYKRNQISTTFRILVLYIGNGSTFLIYPVLINVFSWRRKFNFHYHRPLIIWRWPTWIITKNIASPILSWLEKRTVRSHSKNISIPYIGTSATHLIESIHLIPSIIITLWSDILVEYQAYNTLRQS